MTAADIIYHRLYNQHIADNSFITPAQVVASFGATQAQDYANAKWAVGLRMHNTTDEAIEGALADGSVVRTWAFRGTLQFIAATDVRWMLSLIAPRLETVYGSYYRKMELDNKTLKKSYTIITKALQGHKQLTRPELAAALQKKGIATHELRMNLILVRAALDRVICQGPRHGKQFTFTLLDEWIPTTKPKTREEALAQLAARYFSSRGPATLQDFTWWSGLTTTEARAAIEAIKHQLSSEVVNNTTYWVHENILPAKHSPSVYLLPAFDEYLISYKDRSLMLDPVHNKDVFRGGNGIFNPTIVANGHIAGVWKRTFKKDSIFVDTNLFGSLNATQQKALIKAVDRFARFAGKAVTLQKP